MLKTISFTGAAVALVLSSAPAPAKELKSIGISLGSLGNPFFVALSKGAEFEARKTNPNVKVTTVGFEYDLGKQVTQIDNFIAARVDLTLLNPGDPKAIGPAIKKAQAAGIVVVAVDTAAEGADATVTTNNVQAGEISCQYIVDTVGGKGTGIKKNGPQDPFFMARRAVQLGVGILSGQKPASNVELLPSKLVTRDNIAEYKGWTSDRSQ